MEHRLLVAAPLSKRRRRLRMPPAKTSRGLACAAPASTLGAGSIKQLAIPASSLTSLELIPIPKMGEQKARSISGIGSEKLRESLRSASR
ncbi:unnamed protein product [Prorocentrum cordatum]|nr:unnamed protein product [Polarella glacialis]